MNEGLAQGFSLCWVKQRKMYKNPLRGTRSIIKARGVRDRDLADN